MNIRIEEERVVCLVKKSWRRDGEGGGEEMYGGKREKEGLGKGVMGAKREIVRKGEKKGIGKKGVKRRKRRN